MADQSKGAFDVLTELIKMPSSLTTPEQFMLGMAVIVLIAAYFIRSKLIQWTFAIVSVLTIMGVLAKPILEVLTISNSNVTTVRVYIRDAEDPTHAIQNATALIPLKDHPFNIKSVNEAGMVLDHYENYDLPEKLSDWKTVVTANGFEQATAPLQLMGDKSRQATVELKRLPKNTKPITDEPTQIMAPIPMPKPSTPTTPALSPDDVRTWKVTIFGCTEHVDESMPAAKKIATSLTSKGYQNVVAKRWPLAGTMQTVNGESFYYALPGPFTLNLTSAKAKQAAQLRKDLSSISGLPALADNVVGTEYVRSLTAVVCPGFTEDDRYE